MVGKAGDDEGSGAASTVWYLLRQGIQGMEGCSDPIVRRYERSLPQGIYETLGKYPNQHDVGQRRILQCEPVQCTQHDRRV